MQFTKMIRLFMSGALWNWCLLSFFTFSTVPFCSAGDKEDKVAVRQLVEMLESYDENQSTRAAELFALITPTSNIKPVAAYSLALIQMREGKYSEAWKNLAADPQDPAMIKIGKERLKLWLLLQAGATDKAEPQFKRLVTASIGANATAEEQVANGYFIGGVVGMLEAAQNDPCISKLTIDKAKDLFLKKVESKNAISKMQDKINESYQWGTELIAFVDRFESIGIEKAREQNRTTQENLIAKKQERSRLNDELKSTGKDKQILEDERRSAIKNRKILWENLTREQQSKPPYPSDPGPRPRQPDRPEGSYKTNPRTQQREYVAPTRAEESLYEKELGVYNVWPKKVADYQRECREYPAKISQWEQRLAAIQAKIQAADQFIAEKEKAIATVVADIKQGVGSDLRQNGNEQSQLERTASLSELALKIAESNDPKSKRLSRPSNFKLLDYESECLLIRKSLR